MTKKELAMRAKHAIQAIPGHSRAAGMMEKAWIYGYMQAVRDFRKSASERESPGLFPLLDASNR